MPSFIAAFASGARKGPPMSISAEQSSAPAQRVAAARPVAQGRVRGYVWVHVIVAALAMVATLPGRTHGLGLITEPLLRELQLDRVQYGHINLWATLIGALFCLPCGWLIDRLGPRVVLGSVLLFLGGVVVFMSRIVPGWGVVQIALPWSAGILTVALGLFLLILLTRALGQSALSVVSLALMGKSAGRHSGLAYGVYSFVIALGFSGAFAICKIVLKFPGVDWRVLWAGIGFSLVALALPAAWLVHPSILAASKTDAETARATSGDGPNLTLGQALRTPTFWVFGLATSLYGLVAAGVSLFNQSILAERHFDRDVFLTIVTLTPLVGLASNLATGWLSRYFPLGRLLAVAMLVLAAALSLYPLVSTLTEVFAYAAAMAIAGGMVTVVFFAVWARAFGSVHLGKIQGAAQMMTVLASAVGPLLLAVSKESYGSYVPLFYALAPVCALLGVAAWLTPAGDARR
jgi:MFS family permease